MSASVLLNGAVVSNVGGTQAQLDSGLVKGALVASGTQVLVAGTATVTITAGSLTATSTILAVPAGSGNVVATSGTIITTALVAPAAGSPYVSFTLTSNNAADVGTYRWMIFA